LFRILFIVIMVIFIFLYFCLFCLLFYFGIFLFLLPSPVRSVFYLIFIYILAAILLFVFFFDFFSFIYIIVYVGALFVLFLFVVKLSSQVNGPIAYFYYEFVYFIIALLVSFFLSIFVLFFDLDFYFFDLFEYFFWFDWSNVGYGFLVTLGQVLYSEFFLVMILNIILLFIGAVFPIFYLLGDYNVFRRNQDVFEQVSRSNRLLFFRVK